MRHKVLTLGLTLAVLCLIAGPIMRASAQTSSSTEQSAQSTPTSSQKRTSGERTVVGCVVKEGDSFVLKGEEGTYPLDTDRDLTPYVGKRVKIAGRWEATGTTTTAPISESKSAQPQAPGGEAGAAATPVFVGDLHLHITGDVIGDCTATK